MADEKAVVIPKGCDWESLKALSGTKLTDHYNEALRKLRESEGLLGAIFTQATSRFNNPVNLRRLIDMIDEEEWSSLGVDGKEKHIRGFWYKPRRKGRKALGKYSQPTHLISRFALAVNPSLPGKK